MSLNKLLIGFTCVGVTVQPVITRVDLRFQVVQTSIKNDSIFILIAKTSNKERSESK